ncbi:MAG: exodeoxyribonuclease VII small subunit [Coriobacteriales bacterium]|jgi:exodeoxyribonuclease VII small subunit|nr:exodeoxyribonuclease VII small subunit [Coriobacteriales bacterium]
MDNQDTYVRVRERLEEIVLQVKSKDVPLEKSLDLYEEALRLGGICAEMIDRTDFSVEELDALQQTPKTEAGAPQEAEEEGTEQAQRTEGESGIGGKPGTEREPSATAVLLASDSDEGNDDDTSGHTASG